ncbi:glutamate 5-kinase [Radiomyces spectabilis]|uniref:glutamate 5-kinase n=1 Tax=Radiomyces spectabilis TaxID=64574 RepID=UPI00221FE7A9|nr:glutamate 5-kinase [Radiomyces spectabilis]KAI8394108.1 glutamate 5-kinase [Radiomyces spectabilis]
MLHKNAQNTTRPNKSSLTIVIKVGTSSICDEKTHFPLLSNLSSLVEAVLKLKSLGHRVVLVTSAAIGTGLRRLNMAEKPSKLSAIQALAAVGQGRLMALYDDLFGQFHQPVAQILLTKNDLADRSQYLNAVNCLEELLTMGVVPIVNENDTISTQGVRFGDNDTLSAITAGMVKADYLFLLTDVDCLYTDNPRSNPDAKPVLVCDDIGSLKEKVSVTSRGSALGTGGMMTKLIAADLATAAGVTTIIAHGATPSNIIKIIQADAADEKELEVARSTAALPMYTRFTAKNNPLLDRKWWILHGLHTAGIIYVDEGAARAILSPKQRSSLFAAGIVDVANSFVSQQAVQIVYRKQISDNEFTDVVIGKGLVNYSGSEVARIKRCKSSEIPGILGYIDAECVIHRDNLVRTMKEEQL